MCGIVAFTFRDKPVSRDLLETATKRLSHRGPDDHRIWVSPDASVGLGHARLSVIDLQTGSQPLANEAGSIHAIVNGEFYGYEAIREELRKRGHVLSTRSDSEILIHLYEDFGFDCLHHLRGEFAFVLWDERKRTLFAARDRFGIKPLYYADIGQDLYIASEVKALLAAGVPAQWDREAFFQATQALVAPDRSLFKGIRQLPAGQYLVAKAGHLRIRTYWDFDYPPAEALEARPDEVWIEELRQELDEAVRLRLRADVPVGIYLSAGIDSGAVLGIACQHASKLNAFSVFFPDNPAHDEESGIRESSARAGVNLHSISVTDNMVADNIVAAVTQWEDLPKSEWVVGKYLLSRLVAAHGTKVVLTGEGSDEVFAGHMALVYDSRGVPIQAGADAAGVAEGQLETVRRILGFVPVQMLFREMARARIGPLLSREFAAEFAHGEPLVNLLDYFDCARQLTGRERLSQSMYIWSKTMLQNFFMTACGDRSEMAHSVEGRVPFLDHHVVELARKLPASAKVRGRVGKYILREAVKPVVPAAAYQARKKDFVTQESRISQPDSKIGMLLQDTLRGPSLSANPFFDRRAVLKLLDDLKTADAGMRHQWDAALLNILGSCILQDAYGL
ncbi:MAG TPA: asparagine synthase (glutamine-hydrolyzing) [Candidatus Binatia bacterium]